MSETITAQEVLEQVVRGVVAQGVPSVDAMGYCVYRGPNGLKCAAGQVIRDNEYDPLMEGAVFGMTHRKREFATPERLRPHVDLLQKLQEAHDNSKDEADFVNAFLSKARTTAMRFHLTMPELPQ